ncbi:MAG: TonB-dependent receptor [Candidatus Eisenbacteria sp.]|nr:TonB-dependent receptor [Candidatus Eisenbacteria bacterium]
MCSFLKMRGATLGATALGLMVFLVWCSPLWAGTTGKVRGSIVDASDESLMASTNIEVVGTRMGAASDFEGYYVILNMPPGTYTVRASFIGYQAVVVEGVKVTADRTTEVNFTLEESPIEMEEVVIQATRSLIVKDLTSSQVVFSGLELDEILPLESYPQVLSINPGYAADIRGSHVRGGRSSEINYQLDGFSIKDPIFKRLALHLPQNSVSEMTILSGGFNAEFGDAQSAIVNMVSREGGRQWSGQVLHRFALPFSGVGSGNWRIDQNDTGERKTRFTLSGPLLSTPRVALFGVYERSAWDDWDPHVHTLDNQGRTNYQALGTLTMEISPRAKLKIGGLRYDATWRIWEAVRQLVPDTFLEGARKSSIGYADLSHLLSDETYYRLRIGYHSSSARIAQPDRWWDINKSEAWNTGDPNALEGVNCRPVDIISPERNEDRLFVDGDNNYFEDRYFNTLTLRTSLVSQVTPRHEIQVGGDLERTQLRRASIYASAGNTYGYKYDAHPTYGALYIQDKMEYEGMVVNLGLRGEFFNARTDVPRDVFTGQTITDRDPATPVYPWDPSAPDSLWGHSDRVWAPTGYRMDYATGQWEENRTQRTGTKFKLCPRIGVSHPISDRDVFHFFYGHFYETPPANYLYDNSTWNTNGFWMMAGNPNLNPEHTVSYEMGVDHLVTENVTLDITGFYKDISDLIDTRTVNDANVVEIADSITTYSGITIAAPFPYEYTMYDNLGHGNVRGFEVTLKKHPVGRWSAQAVYTFMVARGISSDVIEGYLFRSSSRNRPTKKYFLDWDRRHSLACHLGYRDVPNWGFSILWTYATGNPYTVAAQSLQPEQNNRRFPGISRANLHIEKYFRFWNLRETLFLRVNNLFDKRNLVNFNDGDVESMNYLLETGRWTGPYDDPTVYGSPRVIKAGFRVDF